MLRRQDFDEDQVTLSSGSTYPASLYTFELIRHLIDGCSCSAVVKHTTQEQKLMRLGVQLPPGIGLFVFFFFPFPLFIISVDLHLNLL